MSCWSLRAPRPDESTAITDMIFASKASNGYDPAFMEACRDELRVTPEKLAKGWHRVAVRGPKILGSVSLENLPQSEGVVSGLFVAPSAQGTGVGRALWNSALDHARSAAMTKIRLDADPMAVPFYTAMGCQVVGEAPSGSIAGRMLPLMEFRL